MTATRTFDLRQRRRQLMSRGWHSDRAALDSRCGALKVGALVVFACFVFLISFGMPVSAQLPDAGGLGEPAALPAAAAGAAASDVVDTAHGDSTRAELSRPPLLDAAGRWPPALFLLLAGALVCVLPRFLRAVVCVAAPVFCVWYILTQLASGMSITYPLMSQSLEILRVDRLSILFGVIFSLVAAIAGVFAWHMSERRQQSAALLYAGGAVGVTFAGDYLTLYAFWELMAIASTVLIWARRAPASAAAGRRYVIFHLVGGSLLLGGILLLGQQTGSFAFDHLDPHAGGSAAWWILLGVAVNAAIPPLGPWLPDSYPRATTTGAIFCSALTTKTAVYVLIRGFHGWEILVVAGVVMALYGVVYAVLANDIRELLAYHIISQVGYMVAGVGLGTQLAVNGAAAHAVCHILYKSVLFMGCGAVIHTTGKEKLTELGGFVTRQKLIFALYMIGAFSISGFPLFNGFISKSMVTAAAHEVHVDWAFLLLMLASVGTFLHTGLKLPYGIWFGDDAGIHPRPAPWNMVAALAVGGFLCTLLGVQPHVLYAYLPFEVYWEPYTTAHVVEMVQLLLFTFFVFYLFIPKLHGQATLSIDTDVVYRKPAPLIRFLFVELVGRTFDAAQSWAVAAARRLGAIVENPTGKLPGALPRSAGDEPGYDEDRDRRPLGVSLALTLLAFVVLALWTMLSGCAGG